MTAWTPTDLGVQQICHLLAEIQKPGTNQAQVISSFRHCPVLNTLVDDVLEGK